MNETEWLAASLPKQMIDLLRQQGSERKLRLFACACCRRHQSSLKEVYEGVDRAVGLCELFADGRAGPDELRNTELMASTRAESSRDRPPTQYLWAEVAASCDGGAWNAATRVAFSGVAIAVTSAEIHEPVYTILRRELPAQVRALRCLFGNPFRPALPRLAWAEGHPHILEMARTIYAERLFADLPVLADALEEAGCPEEDMLQHCRELGEHARGCWVVDAILGKG
jgi:hypothetical protein